MTKPKKSIKKAKPDPPKVKKIKKPLKERISAPKRIIKKKAPPTAKRLFNALNIYRERRGLSRLKNNSKLIKTSKERAEYQFKIKKIQHEKSGHDKNHAKIAAKNGFGYGTSEIILGTNKNVSAQDIIKMWDNSKRHKNIINSKGLTDAGIFLFKKASRKNGKIQYGYIANIILAKKGNPKIIHLKK